jgi:hypothetical protein
MNTPPALPKTQSKTSALKIVALVAGIIAAASTKESIILTTSREIRHGRKEVQKTQEGRCFVHFAPFRGYSFVFYPAPSSVNEDLQAGSTLNTQ